jgi:site-specific recombinase XerD
MYFTLKEPNKDKKSIIYIRYYVKKEKDYFKISSGFSIHPKDWSKENRLPKSKRGGDSYKFRRITDELIKLNDKLHKAIDNHGKELTIGHLKEHFSKKKNQIIYLKDFWKAFIKEREEMQEVGVKMLIKYRAMLTKTLRFEKLNKKQYKLNDLDDNFYAEFITFMRKEYNLNDNTLHRYMSIFKTMISWCSKKGYKVLTDYNNIKIAKYETNDVHLTELELKLLEDAKLSVSNERARDLFLIGAYTGQRFSDYSMFEKADVREGAIVKKAKKTKITSFIPLHNKLKKLLDKYEWKLPKISSQKFNLKIQKICKELKINDSIKKVSYMGKNKKEEVFPKWKLIGSHTARRTFITLMSERGMPDHQLMQIAGIKDAKTLLKYKKFNLKTLIQTSNKLWD